jgi:hypothetical protein
MDIRKNRRRILPIWQELRGEEPFKKEMGSVEAIDLEPVMEEKPRAHRCGGAEFRPHTLLTSLEVQQ